MASRQEGEEGGRAVAFGTMGVGRGGEETTGDGDDARSFDPVGFQAERRSSLFLSGEQRGDMRLDICIKKRCKRPGRKGRRAKTKTREG